jgi:predicted O-methyltransferase YrrM
MVGTMTIVTDAQIAAIPGWLQRIDVAAFRVLLPETAAHLSGGDLAEMGVYQGKSAVLLGSYLQQDEILTVIDLFGADAGDAANSRENGEQYADLTRKQFEGAYKAVHGVLPLVVQDFSSAITEHANHGSHRFVHIDASHLYEHVVGDLAAARTLLKPDGVVVIDDYQSRHTPGVAAAAWQAMSAGLHPFLLTPAKMYATWGDATPWKKAIDSWVTSSCDGYERQMIADDEVIRVWSNTPKIVRFIPPAALPALSRLRARFRRSPGLSDAS